MIRDVSGGSPGSLNTQARGDDAPQAESKLSSQFPYLPDVGLISLVPGPWEYPWWQVRRRILPLVSRYFHVVWCNPPQSWRKLFLPVEYQPVDPPDDTWPGLSVYRPERWLPGFGRPSFLARWTMRQRLLRAKQILIDRGCSKIILNLWRPHFAAALDLIDYDLCSYHIDDEYTFSPIEIPVEEIEARIISRADQVFIHSPALMEKKGKMNPRTLLVPNGVDYSAYIAPYSEPEDLRAVPHPRIGYVGIIKNQLDFELLMALAERHGGWSFVLIGPHKDKSARFVEDFSRRPNVYFLGGKEAAALPAYTQHLDVCMLCYKVNDYTKFIYPLKLHEYLASGRPAVGSPIPCLEEFAQLIRIARTVDEWSRALEESLAPAASSPAQVASRRNVARQYDWNILAMWIVQSLCHRLGPSYVERLGKVPTQDAAPTAICDS